MSASERVRPTLEEVGRAAGVSRATVSRVINLSPKVSPEVRATVERAIAELGYAPNRAARTLVTRRTDTIALYVSEPEERVFSQPFFAAVVRGIGAAAAEADRTVVLVMARDERERERARRFLGRDHVDGVVLMSLHGDEQLPQQLKRDGMPVVQIGRPFRGRGVPYVDADNRGGAQLAVEHLLAAGRRRIAHLSGPLNMGAGVDRLEGYRDVLARDGRPELVEEGDFSESSGYDAMGRLLDRDPALDAVFVASDVMAAGAYRALRERGRDVPGDVAVVGFDDAPVAEHVVPPLTTIRQPVDAMTRRASEILFAHIAGHARGPRAVVCPTELVRRDST